MIGAACLVFGVRTVVYLVYDKKQKWYRRALPQKPFVSVTRVNPDGTGVVEFARKPYVVLRVESFAPRDAAAARWLEGLSTKFAERMIMAVQTTGGPSHHADARNNVHRLLLVEASEDATACGATITQVEQHLSEHLVKRMTFDPTVFDYTIAQEWQYVHYFGEHLDKHTGAAIELLNVEPSALHTAIVSLQRGKMSYDIFIFRHPKRLLTEGERRIYVQYLELLRTGKLHFAAAFPDEPFQHFVQFRYPSDTDVQTLP